MVLMDLSDSETFTVTDLTLDTGCGDYCDYLKSTEPECSSTQKNYQYCYSTR
jgi:hypothetical protein